MGFDKNQFRDPGNEFRFHRICHELTDNYTTQIPYLKEYGVGGVVTNSRWHNPKAHQITTDEKGNRVVTLSGYLQEEKDFDDLRAAIHLAKENGMRVWLYDEMGYPSGSADGLTLKDHPEYEAQGFARLVYEGVGEQTISLPRQFQGILYASATEKSGGEAAVVIEGTTVTVSGKEWTLYCFAQAYVFEGAHAEKCGWGPRHYLNIMDQAAVGEFLHNTYETYYRELGDFRDVDGIFTDEPSLMSAYINISDVKPYAFFPWCKAFPETYRTMYGKELSFPELYEDNELGRLARIHFEQTVAKLVRESFYEQIDRWCTAHGTHFSGHNLLEEHLQWHVCMNGNLMDCLKVMTWPGVDVLTGNPKKMRDSSSQSIMAPRFVGSAARMTGKTERVMVEICPVDHHTIGRDYTWQEERSTMDMIFFSGINHINSYLSLERLGEGAKTYIDHFARCSYLLRQAKWNDNIAMYYPIETAQSYFLPVNDNSGHMDPRMQKLGACMNELAIAIAGKQRDFTIVDADWIAGASVKNGRLQSGELSFATVVMPGVTAIAKETLEKLLAFEQDGGRLVWAQEKPEIATNDQDGTFVRAKTEQITISKNPVEDAVAYQDSLVTFHASDAIWCGRYRMEEGELWFVVNGSPDEQTVQVSGSGLTILNPDNGEITKLEGTSLLVPGYDSVFIKGEK